jgi:DNA invertase Pin-like site-specific DNA recombinase
MYDADRALPAPDPARNGSQRALPTVAPAGSVTALGYVSVPDLARLDDPELKDQEAAIHQFCTQRGWKLVGIVFDVESSTGRSLGRPSLANAIKRLRDGEASCLVVAQLARLCPSVAELGDILDAVQQANSRVVALEPPLDTGTQLGREEARLLTSVSRWERARRAAKTSAARQKADVLHSIPPDLKRRIVRMRKAGMTLQAIADDLNDDGVPTPRGGAEWRPSSVQAALGYKRPRPWHAKEPG